MSRPISPDPHPPAWRFLLPAGVVEAAALAALAWWPGALLGPWRWLLFGTAFGAYALAASRIKDARGGALLVWGVAIAVRLLLLPAPPELSHDVYRYLWDGQVQAGGANPYLYPPEDPAVAAQRAPLLALVPDPSTHSPHAPLAQIAFAALALIGGAVLQAKLLWLGFDLATGWLLGRVALITGRSRRLTQLLYLWSPLLVVEVAWNGHMVSMALFLMTLVVLLARAPFSSGIAAGLAAMVHPAAGAVLPPLAWRHGWRFVAGALLGLIVALAPYVSTPGAVFRALTDPWPTARAFEGPFLLFDSTLPGGAARLVVGLVVLAVAVTAAARGFRPERAFLWVLGTVLLLAPVMHPEHALWILPFAALRLSLPWLLFTGLAFLAYAGAPAGSGGLPFTPLWAQLALWLPLVALLAVEGRRLYQNRFPLPPVEF